eukprot:1159861-Pelagomonas_calceolata.AAC.1
MCLVRGKGKGILVSIFSVRLASVLLARVPPYFLEPVRTVNVTLLKPCTYWHLELSSRPDCGFLRKKTA